MTEEQLFIIAKLVSSDWKWFRATDLKLKYRGGSSGLRATRETGKKVHEIVFGSVFLYFRLKWFIWNPLNLLLTTNRLLIANNQSIKGELEQNCFSGLEKLPEFLGKYLHLDNFISLTIALAAQLRLLIRFLQCSTHQLPFYHWSEATFG